MIKQEFIDFKIKNIKEKGLSYSRFKNFDYHPITIFKEREIKYNDNMDTGSVLDLLLQNNTDIEVLDLNKITGQLGQFIELYALKYNELLTNDEIEELQLEIYNNVGFKQKTLIDIKNIFLEKENQNYFNYLLKKKEKFVVTTEIYNKAKKLHDEFEKFYIDELYSCENFQLDDTFIYNDVKLRVIIDTYSIDYFNKIINIFDFKTNSIDFIKSYNKFNYKLQAVFYYLYFKNLYPDYQINFYFLTINTEYNKCEKYLVSQETLNIEIQNFNKLLNDYKWHLDNNLWEYKKEYYENNYYII